MNYQLTEASIKDRMEAVLTAAGWDSYVLPEKQSEFERPLEKPAVWVSYQFSKFDQTNDDPRIFSTGEVNQKEVLNFEITVQSTRLRGIHGIYKGLDLVRQLLVGFEPENCRKLYLVEIRPLTFAENLWTYKVMMACQSFVIEDYDEDLSEILNQVTLEHEAFMETIIAPDEFIKASASDYLVTEGNTRLVI